MNAGEFRKHTHIDMLIGGICDSWDLYLCTCLPDREQWVLKPWMTGIMAVTVFLFLVFVVFLVKKAWCGHSR